MIYVPLRPGHTNRGRTYMFPGDAVLPSRHGLQYTTSEASFGSAPEKSYGIKNLLAGCDAEFLGLCRFAIVTAGVETTGAVESDLVSLVLVNRSHGPSPHPLNELEG